MEYSGEKLNQIATTLEAIKKQGRDWKRAVFMGIFQGAGIVLGGIIALALLGWLLAILGVVPGFDTFEQNLNRAVDAYQRR